MLSTNLLEIVLFHWCKICKEYQPAQLMKMTFLLTNLQNHLIYNWKISYNPDNSQIKCQVYEVYDVGPSVNWTGSWF